MQQPIRFLTVILGVLLACGIAQASGANFRLSAVGVELGKPDDENADVPKYAVKVKVGQKFTLAAEGIVLPRGGNPSPGEIDAGAWLFDDEAFKIIPSEKVKFDKTKAVVSLEALKAGKTRVRFVGDILGRYLKYDVTVEVTEK